MEVRKTRQTLDNRIREWESDSPVNMDWRLEEAHEERKLQRKSGIKAKHD
jgi:hypothetical protein